MSVYRNSNRQKGGQEKPCLQKPRKEKIRKEIWVGDMAQGLNSPSFEGHAAKTEMKAFATKCTMVKKNLVNKEKNLLTNI